MNQGLVPFVIWRKELRQDLSCLKQTTEVSLVYNLNCGSGMVLKMKSPLQKVWRVNFRCVDGSHYDWRSCNNKFLASALRMSKKNILAFYFMGCEIPDIICCSFPKDEEVATYPIVEVTFLPTFPYFSQLSSSSLWFEKTSTKFQCAFLDVIFMVREWPLDDELRKTEILITVLTGSQLLVQQPVSLECVIKLSSYGASAFCAIPVMTQFETKKDVQNFTRHAFRWFKQGGECPGKLHQANGKYPVEIRISKEVVLSNPISCQILGLKQFDPYERGHFIKNGPIPLSN